MITALASSPVALSAALPASLHACRLLSQQLRAATASYHAAARHHEDEDHDHHDALPPPPPSAAPLHPLWSWADEVNHHHLADDHDTAPLSPAAAFPWRFAPHSLELVRAAGGFAGRRQWPLDATSGTLLDHSSHLLLGGHHSQQQQLAGCGAARHFSVMAHAAPATPSAATPATSGAAAYHTTAGLALVASGGGAAVAAVPLAPFAPAPSALLTPAAVFAELSAAFAKAAPRFKGLSRKLALRQANKRIIARVARRLTVGIPVLGAYFVGRLIVKDAQRVRSELQAGETATAGLFAAACAADALDLAAQATIISGLATAHLGLPGLAGAVALLAAADSASLAMAALSFSCGLGGELLAVHRATERGEL